MVNEIKRSYHPLVQFFFYAGMLSPEQLAQIPKTTIDYWRKQNHTELFGYQWVSTFFTGYEDYNKKQKQKIIFKSARLCARLFNSFSILCSGIKGYKTVFKNNVASVINTIDYLVNEIPFDKACKIYNITTQQYYHWKNKVHCTASVLNLCFKTHPSQLTIAECSTIKDAVNEPGNERKKLSGILFKLMREGKLFCSRSTFYKYANLVSERVKKRKGKKPAERLIATRIFEYIHIDTTLIPTIEDGTVRAVIIKDNHCKKILHKGIIENGNSSWIAMLLQETFSMYNLLDQNLVSTIVSDGGSENKGEVTEWIESLNSDKVKKETARTKEFIYTNNEIESVFHIFKHEFLSSEKISNKEQVRKYLEEFHYYNDNERYPIALHGLTPQEVFDGAIPDKNRFKTEITQATKTRYEKNKKGRFCDVCSG